MGKLIAWMKPVGGWVKLNVDGSVLPQSAGCGGVLRDARGKWLCGFAQKLNPNCRVDETEKEGIFKGLQWVWDRGTVRKLTVESDSKGLVDYVNNGGKSADPLICGIRELLSRDWQARLNWIHREANRVADRVAHNAHGLPSFDLHEFHSPLGNCLPALSKDTARLKIK